ncbi:MAG: hypothetical protein KKB82_08480 [Candidatus Omnitrophica bacterium]|nr:hypothetical protein [Candidatus Omnitrophota bacterium]MBU1925937.1 hypothetical protein [Candidatus Omnitrophota bacterium]
MDLKHKHQRKVSYQLESDGKFVIDNYDLAKPFASFFPGIAGIFGIPMWVFYVNRGQGIASFGTKNKNHSILAFNAANRAWQSVTRFGFRTFIRIKNLRGENCYEPFQNDLFSTNFNVQRKMSISSFDFSLEEANATLGLDFKVNYFTLPGESVAGLVRIVHIKNMSTTKKDLDILDGLPQLVPYGVTDRFYKDLSRTIEAWMKAEFVEDIGMPFYKLSVDPTDRPQVMYVQGGNFYCGFYEKKSQLKKCDIIVDPDLVFGPITDFSQPEIFYSKNFQVPPKISTCNKTPAAFSFCRSGLLPKQQICLVSVCGYAHEERYLRDLVSKFKNIDFVNNKFDEYKKIICELQNNILTVSNDNVYNLYCKQTYLDNVLRGGIPLTLGQENKAHTFHLFSRKHGDLERDYNNFLTQATYFSQGNGNYRDINQNLRNDVWFNPRVEDSNIFTFFNLLQLDGFNPLVVFGTFFCLRKNADPAAIAKCLCEKKDLEGVLQFISRPFVLGEFFMYLEKNGIKIKVSNEALAKEIISDCEKRLKAEHGDGFWIDHWTYNLDALEAYLAIYPERAREIIFEKCQFVFFENFVKVKPRCDKFVLFEDKVRQYHAVTLEEIKEDSPLSRKIHRDDWRLRADYGRGPVYKTTLLVKMMTLITNKMASFDPFGCGLEMEANKPGWYDALNGLPGLFGSSTCEVFELKRLIVFIQNCMDKLQIKPAYCLELPWEIYEFTVGLEKLIKEYFKREGSQKDFWFWDKSCALKEDYRRKTALGIGGKEKKLNIVDLRRILKIMELKTTQALKKLKEKKGGLYHTYFINEVVEYEKIPVKSKAKNEFRHTKEGHICVQPLKFRQVALPLFLEGQVHAFRIMDTKEKAKELYQNIKNSPLYDAKLKMFKVNASLKEFNEEIGRARVFVPGWLENESIWLHMEYKLLLELLRHGLYNDFFREFKNVLIPFQPPERYGRSILENSSFLVSSAYHDKKLHGNGFVARLSGSTAEFLNIWLWLNLGMRPFKLDRLGELKCDFEPVLPEWMFTKKQTSIDYYAPDGKKTLFNMKKDSYAFMFLGKTLVVYYNPKRKNTFGKEAAVITHISLITEDEENFDIYNKSIPAAYARMLRAGKIKRILVTLE